MMEHLRQPPFMWQHAQRFDQSAIVLSNEAEEMKYIASLRQVPRLQAPWDANIISSHVVYRIRVEDDNSLHITARIASHEMRIPTRNIYGLTAVCAAQPISDSLPLWLLHNAGASSKFMLKWRFIMLALLKRKLMFVLR